MGRKKLVLEPIPRNTTKWKETFRKRKASLFKKATELSTLCDVETCVVLFEGPDDPTPFTWPPREEDALAVVSHFMSVPEAERAKKMLHAESILPQQVQVKVPEMQLQLQELQLELQKIDRENRELEAAVFLNDILSGQPTIADVASMESMVDLSAMVQKRASEVNRRISELASVSVSQPPDHIMAPEMGTTSAALLPGWCGEAVNDLGFFFPEQPPLTSGDVAAQLPNLGMVGDHEKEKDERCVTNDNASLAVVGTEMEDDMEEFLENLIKACKSGEGAQFWESGALTQIGNLQSLPKNNYSM